MKPFAYASPKTLKEALALLSDRWGQTEILAGGTDLVTALKQGITQPERVVSLRHLNELRGVEVRGRMLRIGAMTSLGELVAHEPVRQQFPSLVTAVEGIGSPQLVQIGTVGGDLCQRPRCWYFRNGFGLLAQHEGASLVRKGDNRYHAIFGNDGAALFVHPSSLAPVFVALGAEMTIAGAEARTRTVPAAEFFRTPSDEAQRETVLKPTEILAEINVPVRGLANATYEVRHRHGLDWPYVTASVAYLTKDGQVSEARVVLGHVAPVPWVSASAATALNGAKADEATAGRAGSSAAEGARPLSGNAYKVQLVKTAVKRAVLSAAKA